MPISIGIDFDNTIVCYDGVFYVAASERGWLPEGVGKSKDTIRDYFRTIGKESLWTELQGYVYGTQMHLAKPFSGIEKFFQAYEQSICIISHKTKIPFLGPPYDLHLAAIEWLKRQSFAHHVPAFFELTLQEKLSRIEKVGCDCFIDDLPEILLESTFPKGVEKILFDPTARHPYDSRYKKFSSWNEIAVYLDFATF